MSVALLLNFGRHLLAEGTSPDAFSASFEKPLENSECLQAHRPIQKTVDCSQVHSSVGDCDDF